MNQIISQLNQLAEDWKERFDVFKAVALSFSENGKGFICINDKPLDPAAGLEISNASITPKSICVHFTNDTTLLLEMHWPEEGVPFLVSACIGLTDHFEEQSDEEE